MSIITDDFALRLSGGASNEDANAALGGAISSEPVSSSVDALFDAVPATEALAGHVEYRCIYLLNASDTDTMVGARVWVEENTPLEGTALAIGLGTSAVNGTEQTVGGETTAPTDVTFSTPSAADTGLTIGNIPAGQHKAIWLRRTVTAGAGKSPSDTWELGFRCETT